MHVNYEDWEREALKDDIYLQELRREIELEWEQYERRKPAIITVKKDDDDQPIKTEVPKLSENS